LTREAGERSVVIVVGCERARELVRMRLCRMAPRIKGGGGGGARGQAGEGGGGWTDWQRRGVWAMRAAVGRLRSEWVSKQSKWRF
jgi:hypothetical protein